VVPAPHDQGLEIPKGIEGALQPLNAFSLSRRRHLRVSGHGETAGPPVSLALRSELWGMAIYVYIESSRAHELSDVSVSGVVEMRRTE
jgi:hypothetical protein